MKKIFLLLVLVVFMLSNQSCKKDGVVFNTSDTTAVALPTPPPFDINSVLDAYGSLTGFSNYLKWGSYNVHDPSIFKDGDWYYCYTTDASYGNTITTDQHIQMRKSKDLVNWIFVGWAFNGIPAMGAQYITSNGGTPFGSLWAPYVLKVGNEYRLYYSLSSAVGKLSCIGLATSTSPIGPWVEKGITVGSKPSVAGTNAIDPTVIVTSSGDHWMHYGSAYDGIYVVKLSPTTGLALTSGDKGKRIASRGSTSGKANGNIEGPEIIYNSTLKKYFLFMAYDWIDTKYNTRVGRSDNPDGPFYDFNGVDMNTNVDHGPMIVVPYKFMNHGGWQGVSHPAVFSDGNGQYFIANQGRPNIDKYFMDMHVRKLFWTTDGWPVASPERYANVDQTAVISTDLAGNWEQIVLGYSVVPGYSVEQTDPQMQVAFDLALGADGKINGATANTWSYAAPVLTMSWNNGQFLDKVIVSRERDWENKKTSTIVFTGLNGGGTAIWGKKK
jgi:arabinan endo-1,5-alpha-L-arabinosidase